jgi:hypothetical protein
MLTADNNAILSDFATRRKSFDNFIKDSKWKILTRLSYGFPTRQLQHLCRL